MVLYLKNCLVFLRYTTRNDNFIEFNLSYVIISLCSLIFKLYFIVRKSCIKMYVKPLSSRTLKQFLKS